MDVHAAGTAGSGPTRSVVVPPERLERWLRNFAERHGEMASRLDTRADGEHVVVVAADGAVAEATVPFPPLDTSWDTAASPSGLWAALVEHAGRPRRVGLVLVRLGGFAVGVADGGALVTSKVGSRPVHGRAKPGGSSAARFARRREGQARVALAAAADVAARLLLPEVSRLDGVVLGGHRSSVDAVLADPRLTPLRQLVRGRLLDVPDPRLRVLEAAVEQARAVPVRVTDP